MTHLDTLTPGVTVYCGSCPGADDAYIRAARSVGHALARVGVPLIYGGGRMGLMHAVAHACMEQGGTAVAVIPSFMVDRGWDDPQATQTIVTADMSERKKTFAARSRGVIALPGGIGTMEELAEIITWRQLGIFDGNIVILNINGYWDPFIAQLHAAVGAGFMPADHCSLWTVATDPDHAVELAVATSGPLNLQRKF